MTIPKRAWRSIYSTFDRSPWMLVRHDVAIHFGGVVLTHEGCTVETIDITAHDASAPKGFAAIGDGLSYPAVPGLYRLEVKEFPGQDDAHQPEARGALVRFRRTAALRVRTFAWMT